MILSTIIAQQIKSFKTLLIIYRTARESQCGKNMNRIISWDPHYIRFCV